ncbi:unnamed protein product [Pseudo-nitzschia multistriata]|uniref:N-acetyltransferase domain-containing protein n=1 Tax=Pseudo-nitzschia multistriata TaxID=183589 RepID=A0A448Z929_9STRA|nr:unnamed protein product [Pseudo-nitzschia multistriata]
MAFSIQSLLFIASLAATSTDAFVTPSGAALSSRTSTAVYAEAVETSNADFIVRAVEGGEDDPTVVDVAAYRNNMVNPQMMVERAQKKRDSLDTTKEAINGLKAGLLYVGPIIGIGTYVSTSGDNALTAALSNYGLFGGSLGAILAVNNYMGRGVHVPDVPEATNRIVVDLSEGLLRKQDMGFVAVSTSEDEMWKKIYAPSNGIIATVDTQLRNSPNSPTGVRTVEGLPSHLHIKNMDVHYKKRRQGVANALMELIIEHATTKTDAKALTLEVLGANQPAVQLYRKFGFEPRENPNKRSANVFMVKEL